MIVESLMDAAKDNAVYRWDDGIVLIDPEKAKDQNYITTACPYRVICWKDVNLGEGRHLHVLAVRN